MSDQNTTNQQLSILPDETEKLLPVPMAKNEIQGLQGVIAIKAEEETLKATIKAAVLKAYLYHSREIHQDDAVFWADEIKAEILRMFPGIRLGEIRLAIHKGAVGEYGKIYALSIAFFIDCIRQYMNSPERAAAAQVYSKSLLQLEVTNKPSEEEMIEMKKKIVLNAFETFKAVKHYKDYGNYVFDALAEYGGIINLTEENKVGIWKAAYQGVISSFISQGRRLADRSEKLRVLKEVRNNKGSHPLVYAEAKKLALNMIFGQMVELNTDLKTLIK